MAQGGHTELRPCTHSSSSLGKMNAAPLVSATQLHRNRSSLKPWGLLPSEWIGWGKSRTQPEFCLDYSKQQVTPLSVYTAVKAIALYSTHPKPMKYLLIRKALSITGISLLSLRMSENHTNSWRKTSVGKEDNFRNWQIAFPSYRSTLNKDYDASTHCMNLGNYLDQLTRCRYLSKECYILCWFYICPDVQKHSITVQKHVAASCGENTPHKWKELWVSKGINLG